MPDDDKKTKDSGSGEPVQPVETPAADAAREQEELKRKSVELAKQREQFLLRVRELRAAFDRLELGAAAVAAEMKELRVLERQVKNTKDAEALETLLHGQEVRMQEIEKKIGTAQTEAAALAEKRLGIEKIPETKTYTVKPSALDVVEEKIRPTDPKKKYAPESPLKAIARMGTAEEDGGAPRRKSSSRASQDAGQGDGRAKRAEAPRSEEDRLAFERKRTLRDLSQTLGDGVAAAFDDAIEKNEKLPLARKVDILGTVSRRVWYRSRFRPRDEKPEGYAGSLGLADETGALMPGAIQKVVERVVRREPLFFIPPPPRGADEERAADRGDQLYEIIAGIVGTDVMDAFTYATGHIDLGHPYRTMAELLWQIRKLITHEMFNAHVPITSSNPELIASKIHLLLDAHKVNIDTVRELVNRADEERSKDRPEGRHEQRAADAIVSVRRDLIQMLGPRITDALVWKSEHRDPKAPFQHQLLILERLRDAVYREQIVRNIPRDATFTQAGRALDLLDRQGAVDLKVVEELVGNAERDESGIFLPRFREKPIDTKRLGALVKERLGGAEEIAESIFTGKQLAHVGDRIRFARAGEKEKTYIIAHVLLEKKEAQPAEQPQSEISAGDGALIDELNRIVKTMDTPTTHFQMAPIEHPEESAAHIVEGKPIERWPYSPDFVARHIAGDDTLIRLKRLMREVHDEFPLSYRRNVLIAEDGETTVETEAG
ncbi:MAG: hypothetical protein AAB932_03485, partial [Patescibacteria group bacterium]